MMQVDLIVIGAGPAGMAAAVQAEKFGATVLVLDEQAEQGGQIYRGVLSAGDGRRALLGSDYSAGRPLAEAMRQVGIRHEPGATVWRLDPDGIVTYSVGGLARQAHGKQVIIATGALERPVPLPGWTLPGVLTAGAAQILLKSNGIVADNAVLVGSGPLLYLLAVQMVAAGVPPRAMVETQTRKDVLRSLTHGVGALRGWRMITKGLGLIATLRKAGIDRFTAADDIRIMGSGKAESVVFSSRGRAHTIECDNVFLHQGVVPNTQITRSLGLQHYWNEQQRCFQPVVDEMGETSIDCINIAGDGAAINGAIAAEIQGRLAACQCLLKLGRINQTRLDELARPLLRQLSGQTAPRQFLEALYPPALEIRQPADETIICRCEEVTAGDIRCYAQIGCVGPNQTKAFGRSGMGPCQGRYCGLTVTEILAEENANLPQDVGSYRVRAPLKPVTLGELASLAEATTEEISGESEG